MDKAKDRAKNTLKAGGNVPQMDGRSMNVHGAQVDQLRAVCPGVFTDGKVDFDKLAEALAGHVADEGQERYGLSWAGKPKCFAEIAKQTTGTLVPEREESLNFDTAEHVFIEGENLEVLKILQRSYYGRVKMIYIDPPYNTGKDFVYHDSFQRSGAEENEEAGLLDDAGHMKAAYKQNSKDSGRYHSNWLNMMYPRLYLARNLLRDDGVIFISIDDNEVHNLRLLMNEIFGEENFVAQITREQIKGGSQSDTVRIVHDYVLICGKNIEDASFSGHEREGIELKLADEQGKYAKGRELNKWGAGSRREDSPSMYYPIPGPNGEDVFPIRNDGSDGRWRLGKVKMFQRVADGDVIFEKRENGTYVAYEKIRDNSSKIKQFTTLFKDGYTNAKGTEVLKDLFAVERAYFDYSKPVELIKDLIILADVNENDIILDFFAGSGTTAHAVLDLNKEDGGNRKFICVQIPEETPEGSEARKAGYKTIADITKARIRKVIERMQGTQGLPLDTKLKGESLGAIGFKVFKTAPSNFNIWRTREFASGEELQSALEEHIKEVKQATPENKLYEILIKAGYDLNTRIEAKKDYFVVNNGALIVCLAERMDKQTVDAIIAENPKQVICLDSAFDGKDELKVNMYLALRDKKIEFSVV